MSEFSDVMHIGDGSNSNIFTSNLNGQTVVIKKIKYEVVNDETAKHEFDCEFGLLARLKHPNLISIYGAGVDESRKFLVLQFLGGGTLKDKFDKAARSKKAAIFGAPNTFSFAEALVCARELACALNYLHHECCPEAHIVHRDLKPDNIAFTADGRLILFDLGLCTIIHKCETDKTVYEMTSGTGSLRYMAPEVVLCQPYNHKADVYSYGIILWQLISDQTPYDGASKASYIKYACKLGERPELSMTWPKELKELMSACWHQEYDKRPSFTKVLMTLDGLIAKYPLKK
jgi:serine/threonine protein kinase